MICQCTYYAVIFCRIKMVEKSAFVQLYYTKCTLLRRFLVFCRLNPCPRCILLFFATQRSEKSGGRWGLPCCLTPKNDDRPNNSRVMASRGERTIVYRQSKQQTWDSELRPSWVGTVGETKFPVASPNPSTLYALSPTGSSWRQG